MDYETDRKLRVMGACAEDVYNAIRGSKNLMREQLSRYLRVRRLAKNFLTPEQTEVFNNQVRNYLRIFLNEQPVGATR